MYLFLDLLVNALVTGMLLGGFYAAVAVGISISFGMLEIVNIAHPAFIVMASYIVYLVNAHLSVDPILTGVALLPVFFGVGVAIYHLYYFAFERRGRESLRGLAFFSGCCLSEKLVWCSCSELIIAMLRRLILVRRFMSEWWTCLRAC